MSNAQIIEIALNTISCPDSLNCEFFDLDKCNLRQIFYKQNFLVN